MDLQQQLDLSTRLYERGKRHGYQLGLIETLEAVLGAIDGLDDAGLEAWKREARDVIACEREHHL
jgi:hypothetical protein